MVEGGRERKGRAGEGERVGEGGGKVADRRGVDMRQGDGAEREGLGEKEEVKGGWDGSRLRERGGGERFPEASEPLVH